MRAFTRPAAIAAMSLLVVVACSRAAGASPTTSPPPSDGPSSTPSSSPTGSPETAGAIVHPVGATDIVLRYDVGGGFVAPGFALSQTPVFTLYGDGRVVFKDLKAAPPPAAGSATPNPPLHTARLDEHQVQQLLTLALGPAGLATADAEYPNPHVADAPTTTFTIDAGGAKRAVAIMALGIGTPDAPDASGRAGFDLLATRLGNFGQDGTVPTDEYTPTRYRGILLEGFPGNPPASWPWTDVMPADFVAAGDPNALPTPSRVLTPAQVEALGVTPFTGGFQNLTLRGPDGKLYALAVRPLLPDESK
jgi:hypothetical protein